MVLGNHSVVDISNCNCSHINDIDYIIKILLDSCDENNLHPVDYKFHQFKPIGISGVIILSESHITIHTWPEHNFVAVDVFTCGTNINSTAVCKSIAKKLNSNNIRVMEMERGKI